MLKTVFSLFACAAVAQPPKEIDTRIRLLAAEHASGLLSKYPLHAERGALAEVCSALDVSNPFCSNLASDSATKTKRAVTLNQGTSYYVSPSGDDSAAGTKAAPFKTVHRGQQALRSLPATTRAGSTVYLEAGRYEMTKPLVLTSEDSGTE